MKQLTTFIFLLSMSFNVFADMTIFTMAETSSCCTKATPIGFGVQQELTSNLYFDFFVRGNSSGAYEGAGVGYKLGSIDIGGGLASDQYYDTIKVNGKNISVDDRPYGGYLFAQYNIKNWFVRYSFVKTDFNMLGRWTDANDCDVNGMNCATYGNTKSVSTNNHWLWIGYRF